MDNNMPSTSEEWKQYVMSCIDRYNKNMAKHIENARAELNEINNTHHCGSSLFNGIDINLF